MKYEYVENLSQREFTQMFESMAKELVARVKYTGSIFHGLEQLLRKVYRSCKE